MTAAQPLPVSDISAPACGCGCSDDGEPELDVRVIPHAIRHATVFGALGAVPAGGSMRLVAPHDPKPLLAQIAERESGAIEVTYLVTGPDVWTLRLARRA
ncbi:hypothetical protein GCM10009721_21010 [Terrabacter tumescens]|uniref:DUF2249 domain-containing protein n=1 Tax=Terrabacter tumescens TaxID=60443 RepID=A0ABQ2HXL3_9MICO|nr:DUF2249 domain-containing protein [Terrabacter tumescens]GGM94496.1 hypothetical protein GCM10009721_21010 [Terrabacter tumescens]